jgi:hypothetical protein
VSSEVQEHAAPYLAKGQLVRVLADWRSFLTAGIPATDRRKAVE